MQADCNLVLYKTDHYHAKWLTRTNRRNAAPCKFVVQDDGNMVVYDKDGTARWSSGTAQKEKVVKDNNGKKKGKDGKDNKGKKKGKDEEDGEKKVPWKVELKLQDDGNLVLYREDGKQLWASNTAGRKEVPGTGDVLSGGTSAQLNENSKSHTDDGQRQDREEEELIKEENERWEAEKAAEAEEDEEAEHRDVDWQPSVEAEEKKDGPVEENGLDASSRTSSQLADASGGPDDELPVVGDKQRVKGSRRRERRGRFSNRKVVEKTAQPSSSIQDVIDSII